MEQDPEILSQIIDSGECPDCGIWDFYSGPQGGVSENIFCANCGSCFNYTPGFVTQRIHETPKNIVENKNNYKSIDKFIIKKWYKIPSIEPINGRYNVLQIPEDLEERFKWCNNCQERWSLNRYHFYFESKTDAIAFKLRWI